MHPTALTRRVQQIALAVSLIACGSATWAAPEAQFQSAFKHFLQANAGDSAAVEQAAEAFSGLLKSEPTNPVLLAYTGAATAISNVDRLQ